MCSPDYLNRHPFTDIDGLLDQTLLYQEDSRWNWMDWPIWLAERGDAGKAVRRKLKINGYPLLIQAVLAGQGAANEILPAPGDTQGARDQHAGDRCLAAWSRGRARQPGTRTLEDHESVVARRVTVILSNTVGQHL